MHTHAPTPAESFPHATRVRYGVLGFACALSMITYLDRACIGQFSTDIESEFNLTPDQLATVLSAFNLAYALFEVPSGWLGDVFGPRRTLVRIILWWSCFTALTGMIPNHPAVMPFYALVAVQFLFGMGEAGAYPNVTRAFQNWFPALERGTAQGCVWFSGRLAGGLTPAVIALLVMLNIHWRYTFVIFGSFGVVWAAAFWLWFRDNPKDHPAVNEAEVKLIEAGRAPEAGHAGIPWMKLLTSGNLWVLCLIYACASYGWYFNITYLPKYLHDVYKLSKENTPFFAVLAGMPLTLGAMACLVGGLASDFFVARTGDRVWGRRLFGVVGHGLCGVCYFASLFAESPWPFVAALGLAAFFNDLTMGASWASCMDIGKRYSGIVSGCMNTIGNLGGFLAVRATGFILNGYKLPDGSDPALADQAITRGWQVNLCLFGSAYVLATLLWFFFDASKPVAPEEPHA